MSVQEEQSKYIKRLSNTDRGRIWILLASSKSAEQVERFFFSAVSLVIKFNLKHVFYRNKQVSLLFIHSLFIKVVNRTRLTGVWVTKIVKIPAGAFKRKSWACEQVLWHAQRFPFNGEVNDMRLKSHTHSLLIYNFKKANKI